jgi:hypothetical protein
MRCNTTASGPVDCSAQWSTIEKVEKKRRRKDATSRRRNLETGNGSLRTRIDQMPIAYDCSRASLYNPEHAETFFESGGVYSRIQLAVEAARLAYYRTEETPMQLQRLTDALGRVGFDEPARFLDVATGAAGIGSVRKSDGAALLAFRGTQPDSIADIGYDLEAEMTAWPESAGRVHAGFAAATRALLPGIAQWIKATGSRPQDLIITGHSLGAAMATLCASVVPCGWLITLGSPRVGDGGFVATVTAANVRRIVDCCDVVTRLPPPVAGYTHLPTCTFIDRHGVIHDDPSQAAMDADCSAARVEYLKECSWKIGSVLVRDLADHAPINYLRAFWN